ncbi:MAG: aspartate dehydrogenase [candidate division NC10 bacterium]
MRVAFLGFGTIGRIIYSELVTRRPPGLDITGCMDPALSAEARRELERDGVRIFADLGELMKDRPDLVVEAASQRAAKESVPRLLTEGIDVLSMSVGAYLDPDVMAEIRGQSRGKLFLSSGALPGVDVLKAAAVRGITCAELTTRKHPKSLAGAPGLASVDCDLETLREARLVFSGSAQEAVRLFPANVNIAATLSLAGIGPERTRVTIIADPGVRMNIHTVSLRGEFGAFTATIECLPSSNPKTSLVAALSAVALLEGMVSPLRIGT